MTEIEFNNEVKWFSYGLTTFSERVVSSDGKTFLSREIQDTAREIYSALAEKQAELEAILFPINSTQPGPTSPRVRGLFKAMSSVEEALRERPRFAEVKDPRSPADPPALVPYPSELLRDSLSWWTTNLSARFQDLEKGQNKPVSGAYAPGADNEPNKGGKKPKNETQRAFLKMNPIFQREIGIGGIMSKEFVLNEDEGIELRDLAEWLVENGFVSVVKRRKQWWEVDGLFSNSNGPISKDQLSDAYQNRPSKTKKK